jgi:hypothetical protein
VLYMPLAPSPGGAVGHDRRGDDAEDGEVVVDGRADRGDRGGIDVNARGHVEFAEPHVRHAVGHDDHAGVLVVDVSEDVRPVRS